MVILSIVTVSVDLTVGCASLMATKVVSNFNTKKEEVSLHHFKTRAQARSVIFDYIEVFYNRVRRHSKIKNMSPVNFENEWRREQMKKIA